MIRNKITDPPFLFHVLREIDGVPGRSQAGKLAAVKGSVIGSACAWEQALRRSARVGVRVLAPEHDAAVVVRVFYLGVIAREYISESRIPARASSVASPP